MTHKFPHLCSPITIAGRTFSNRMFSAPMEERILVMTAGLVQNLLLLHELLAKGGWVAVTVSECMVHPETDGSYAYHLDTAILNSLAAATYTADAISRHGAAASLSCPIPVCMQELI